MIFIHRRAPPSKLIRNESEWTARWQKIHLAKSGEKWCTGAAHDELKINLELMTHGKCAFCESQLDVASYLQIEHYHAKNHYPNRAFEWDNLFPICSVCNVTKGAENHQGEIIKPDNEDPESFLQIDLENGHVEPQESLSLTSAIRAEKTISSYGLNRPQLVEVRRKLLLTLLFCLDKASHEPADLIKQQLEPLFLSLNAQYKLVIRQQLEDKGWGALSEADRKWHALSGH